MITLKKIMSVIAIAFAVMTIAGSGVYAISADPCTVTPKPSGCDSGFLDLFGAKQLKANGISGTSIQGILVTFASFLTALIAIISVIYLVWNAYKMISDNGDGKSYGAGLAGVKYAVIGLVIALLAFFIVQTIVGIIARPSAA